MSPEKCLEIAEVSSRDPNVSKSKLVQGRNYNRHIGPEKRTQVQIKKIARLRLRCDSYCTTVTTNVITTVTTTIVRERSSITSSG